MTKPPILAILSLAGLALVVPAGAARAQALPPAQWSEPVVVDVNHPAHQAEPEPVSEASAAPEDLGPPLDQAQIAELHRRASASVVPVRAVFRQDPLLYPETIEVEGVATLVQPVDGPPVFVTALILVDGAERVYFEQGGREVEAEVVADARFGLAELAPSRALSSPVRPVPILPVEADDPVEVFSAGSHATGATMGAGEDQYAFYQVSTVGVALGYPLINRRGELVGIGSHLYPNHPGLSLSVPSTAVEGFLESERDEP